MRPFPVLEISTGVTNQNQGQYAFSVSGADPAEVYAVGQKLLAKLRPYPGFLSVSSDYFANTPNLNIDSVNFGLITSATGNRNIQLGARVEF